MNFQIFSFYRTIFFYKLSDVVNLSKFGLPLNELSFLDQDRLKIIKFNGSNKTASFDLVVIFQ